MNTLTLSIVNYQQLQHGMSRHHRFDREGGTIGTQAADWRLLDNCKRVRPIHCEIRWAEDSFCAVDHCNRTFLNSSSRSLGQSGPMRLKDGDQLRIGNYLIQVHYQEQTVVRSLEGFFMPAQGVLAALPPAYPDDNEVEHAAVRPPPEICQALHKGMGSDPLLALDTLQHLKLAQEDNLHGLFVGDQP
ncbi:FHA domain-containing protein [Pseudomonas putida]|uniref:FHA domain-containing protein n=1 Tax=Pseudomonas putida TaxID=303 RepID=A0A4D6X776_PSEPU|nr:FHA domain-containing protein [Pseudomonas putida]QCI11867.1 FHA domain-containing protein [Pseudomonas putida]